MVKRRGYSVQGQVQGVGFRPYVYNLAVRLGLNGFVKNSDAGVEIEIEGRQESIEKFASELGIKPPPLAKIDSITQKTLSPRFESIFQIIASTGDQSTKTALVPPDTAVCDDCLKDMQNIDKFKDYFATNCTNCGPRYSIIKSIPYDRKNSSMDRFQMCKSCEAEYNDPTNRRFHAQPISCRNCGPRLSLISKSAPLLLEHDEVLLKKAASLIQDAKILAIKGIGGYHLVCSAVCRETVQRLRKVKNRPSKPFAVMCRDIEQVKSLACVNAKEEELLRSKEAPVVILKKRSDSDICDDAAPDIDRIGCFLPYTPLWHVLFQYLNAPVIATSANLADEPIIFKANDIFDKLDFVDYILDFDRDIINAVDDSLVQVVQGEKQVLRLARGYAPKVFKLPFRCEKKILAVGANQKNSLTFIFEDTMILSPHIGDLDDVEAFDFFERTVETFGRFYQFVPDLIVHDMHPGYKTTQWAKEQNTPLIAVQHHLAHIYACKAEFGLDKEYLGFSFDGTGYGEDGNIWGGEVFVGDERRYHFKYIKLLGSSKAVKEPRRVALSLLFDELSLQSVLELDNPAVRSFSQDEIRLLYQSYTKNINAPFCSSVGRLFDGVAALSGVLERSSYEGQSGLLSESLYDEKISKNFAYSIDKGVIEIKLVEYILKNSINTVELISMFINTLVKIIVEIAGVEKRDVICSGGVFQNKTLLERVVRALKNEQIPCYFQQDTPINDGGVSVGQAYYAFTKYKS